MACDLNPATSPCQLSVRRLAIKRVSKLRAGLALLQAARAANRMPGRKGISLRMGWSGRLRAVGLRGMLNVAVCVIYKTSRHR